MQDRVQEKLKAINDAYQHVKDAPLSQRAEGSLRPRPEWAQLSPSRVSAPEWLARARKLTSKPLRLKPGEAVDWSNVDNLNEHVEGIRAYREAVRIDPGCIAAWHGLAVAHVQLGETGEAMKAFEEVIRREPAHIPAWIGLGAGHAERRDFRAAAYAFQEAVRIRPDASLFFSLGTAHAQLRETASARAAFREAVRLNPDLAEAWCALGVECAFPGPNHQIEPEEALEAFRFAVRLKPDLSEAWCGLGTTLLGLRRYDEALRSLKEAVRLQPDFGDAWYSLAIAARYSGHSGARALMREAYARLKLLNRDSASRFKELLPYRLRLSLLGSSLAAR
jgi:tetratricopeptide (TPR) repeat protein